MKPSIFAKLSVMMLLEYFIWSSWYVTMSTYMDRILLATGVQKGAAYGALAIATMISPFFMGVVADRFFSAQRIMGTLHILGAVLLYMATQTDNNTAFYWIILVYSLLYMPTIALSNSIAFRQMTDPGKQFPWIRVFGTVGWIVAGAIIGWKGFEAKELLPNTFYMAAIASATLGLFSFILPNTPPTGKQESANASSALGVDAFVMFKDRAYLIFFIAAILICIPLSFYYSFANDFLNYIGMEKPAGKMILGQISEGLFILAIPFLFNRIGVKKMLIIGMVAWAVRYVLFAFGNLDANLWMLYGAIILHGVCYDFFFVTGYMYTEKKASEKIKSAAQGLFTFATYGLGMVIGSYIYGFVADAYTTVTVNAAGQEQKIYQSVDIWLTPGYISAAVLIYFIIFFKEKTQIEQAA